MASDEEPFLSRWSRLKRETPAGEEKAKADEAPPSALPPVESLTPESDFAPFMHPKVQDAMRRVALKKLFSDPRFNVPDAFEPFSGDWTVGEPISEEMLATLNQARTLLFPEKGEEKGPQDTAAAEPTTERAETPKADEPGSKDA